MHQPREKAKQSAGVVDDSYAVCSFVTPELGTSLQASNSLSRPWILDSGCTSHLCGDEDIFECLETSTHGKLKLASQASTDIEGRGKVKIPVADAVSTRQVELNNTLFVPDLRTNLVSVAKITDKGHIVTFHKDFARATDPTGQVKLTADRRGDLYYVRQNVERAAAAQHLSSSELMLWHERLGHLNTADLLKMMSGVGLSNAAGDPEDVLDCEVCLKGKMTRLPFLKGGPTRARLLELIHSDVVGPFRVQSANGARFFVTFVDDASKYCQVYFLSQKSSVLEAFKRYKSLVENQTGTKIKYLQSDNGRKYCNQEYDHFLSKCGIERRLTAPHTPQQNGVAERMNRTLLDMARCFLIQSNLPSMFWSDAIATACYIRNRCPTRTLNGLTPHEKWTGEFPILSHLRVFGSAVYVLDKTPGKDKFAIKSNKGIFVGYPRESKGYRIWMPDARKIVVTRDVKFLEKTNFKVDVEIQLLETDPTSGEMSDSLERNQSPSRTPGRRG